MERKDGRSGEVICIDDWPLPPRLVFAIEWESLVQLRGEAVTDVTGWEGCLCSAAGSWPIFAPWPGIEWSLQWVLPPSMQGGMDDGSYSSMSIGHASKAIWDLHPPPLKGDTGSSELAPAALQVTSGLRVSRQSLCPCVLLPIALRCPLFSLMMYTMYIYKHTHIAFSIPLPGLATPHVVVFISWSAFVSWCTYKLYFLFQPVGVRWVFLSL